MIARTFDRLARIGKKFIEFELLASCTVFTLLLLAAPHNSIAIGTFISAPNRVDMVYDDVRDVLYITDGNAIDRYKVASNSFLSPLIVGGTLKGIDISPDRNTLAVADQSYTSSNAWIYLINLNTDEIQKIIFNSVPYEGGTFTVAFGKDNTLLVSSSFNGSGWVPLRKYDPATGISSDLLTVTQDTMLRASADGSVIGFAESNISDGRFGRYSIVEGSILHKTGYTDGTGWYNYEIGVNNIGTQFAIPTYNGTYITDSNLVKYPTTIGTYAGPQPIGVVYNPVKNYVYFAWSTTPYIFAYDTTTLQQVAQYDFENVFTNPGNHAFLEGRLKMSPNGKLLFATVQGGVRYINLNNAPVANSQTTSTLEDTPKNITLSGTDVDGDPLTYRVVKWPAYGSLSGTPPNLIYSPSANYNGQDQFSFVANDGMVDSQPASVQISVLFVNDPPQFTLAGRNITLRRTYSPQTFPNWALYISPGPPNEASQIVTFSVTNSNPALFAAQPQIDSKGTLTFTPRSQQKGSATVTVVAHDNGGTANGGIDVSAPQQFTVTISKN